MKGVYQINSFSIGQVTKENKGYPSFCEITNSKSQEVFSENWFQLLTNILDPIEHMMTYLSEISLLCRYI